jgi:hypothetical protein
MAQMPAAIATPEETLVITLHAEGGQLYECKAGSDRKLAWTGHDPGPCPPAGRTVCI